MIEVFINGERKEVYSSNISELLKEIGLVDKKIALELNREIVSRTSYDVTTLSPGDKLEVVHFVGGG